MFSFCGVGGKTDGQMCHDTAAPGLDTCSASAAWEGAGKGTRTAFSLHCTQSVGALPTVECHGDAAVRAALPDPPPIQLHARHACIRTRQAVPAITCSASASSKAYSASPADHVGRFEEVSRRARGCWQPWTAVGRARIGRGQLASRTAVTPHMRPSQRVHAALPSSLAASPCKDAPSFLQCN